MLSPNSSLQRRDGVLRDECERRSLDARRVGAAALVPQLHDEERKLHVRPEAMKLADLVDVHDVVSRLRGALPHRVRAQVVAEARERLL